MSSDGRVSSEALVCSLRDMVVGWRGWNDLLEVSGHLMAHEVDAAARSNRKRWWQNCVYTLATVDGWREGLVVSPFKCLRLAITHRAGVFEGTH